MTVAFDLDGCLIDSEELIRQSYRDAGVEAPAGFMALGHHDWIGGDRESVHARKNAAYIHRLAARLSPVLLPAWRTAEMLVEAGFRVALLTGAPAGTISALGTLAPSWPFESAREGLSPAAKTDALCVLGTGVYVDDQVHVAMPRGWRLVQYTGQTASYLYRQVTACP